MYLNSSDSTAVLHISRNDLDPTDACFTAPSSPGDVYIQFLSEYIDNQIGMVAFRSDIQLGEQPSRERNAIHHMYQRIQ